jgi:hypothetical protein
MVTIGNTTLPGVQTSVDSATSTGINVGASVQIGLVGQADFSSGTAQANTLYEIRTPVKAREVFGSGSPLAENVVNALTEGAYPVYAVAAEGTEVVDEDVSAETGTLANVPVSEITSEVTFAVDASAQETVRVLADPSTVSLDADQTAYNPVTGEYVHGATPSTGEATYTHYDYSSAIDVLEAERADILDFVGVLVEETVAVEAAHDAVVRMVDNYDFAVVVAGAASYIGDKSAYVNPFDSSRIQLLYPSRNDDGESIVGSYLGLRAALGINNSPMFKRLQTQTSLAETLSKSDKESLLVHKVVPVANDRRGGRIVEDLTTVTESNLEEDAMRQVLHRLVIDYVTEITNEVSENYIGELHTQSARNSLRSNIVARLGSLMDLNAITSFVVTVEEVDAMTASVDVGIETIKPLRNILASVTAGKVE